MPSGRHRASPGISLRGLRVRQARWVAATAGLVALCGVLVLVVSRPGTSCRGEPVLVSVAAALDIAPAVMEAANQFNRGGPAVNGRCVLIEVTEQTPATVMRTLTGERIGILRARPDAWVPDSSAWIRLARQSGAKAVAKDETPIASSPLVFATTRSLAQKFAAGKTEMTWKMVFPSTAQGRVTPTENEPDVVGVPDPGVNGAGVATVAAVRDIVGEGDAGRKGLTAFVRAAQASSAPDYRSMLATLSGSGYFKRPVVIVPEQSVWTYNRVGLPDPVTILHPQEGTVSLDYPYVVTTGDELSAAGAAAFANVLTSEFTRRSVQRMGFRAADGSTGPDFVTSGIPTEVPRPRPSIRAEQFDDALQAWSRLALPTRMLVLADVSDETSAPAGDGRTRLQLATSAAKIGLQLYPGNSEIGVWEFGDGISGPSDFRELIKVGPLADSIGATETRRARLVSIADGIRTRPGLKSALYDAVREGFREATRTFNANYVNSLLVLVGAEDGPGGASFQDLMQVLHTEWNPERPVQIVVVSFGTDANRGELEQIVKATNGTLHEAKQPGEIVDIFLAAVAQRLCRPACPK